MAKTKCISCKYATVDNHASVGGWIAYECSNPESDFHKALLNVGVDGSRHKRISWSGCECGKRRDANETLSTEGVQNRA